MSPGIFAIVLFAALLHALWNALVKGGGDKTLAMAAVVIGQGVYGIALLPFAPAPAWESWPYIAVSVALHAGYQYFLLKAYQIGDLTQVYPIARGIAPLIVTLVAVLGLGTVLSPMQLAGVVVIGLGICSLTLARKSDGLLNGRAALLAAITGGFIASYSLVDGVGVRIAGSALGFYGAISTLNAVAFAAVLWRGQPNVLRRMPSALRILFLGGGASFAAYALVVYAFLYAPIPLVTALRETSIIFALLIGVFVLREPLNAVKVVSTFITLCGAALLRLAKS